MARNFQTIIQVKNIAKAMKMSFSTEEAAVADIENTVAAASGHLAERWGGVASAVILNKATGETTTII